MNSGEIVTEFTEMAESQTEKLSGIPIDIRITQAQLRLRAGTGSRVNKEMTGQVRRLNETALRLVNGLITFKEQILKVVGSCDLYTTNYPLLIEHILREAKLYRQILLELEQKGCVSPKDLAGTRNFWNRIMMEHALFIRGLLDPTECVLIETADMFAGDYCRLLELAKKQDCRAMDEISRRTLETTVRYRDFKAAGTKGILGCDIRSIILPLLADHVLREANHYLRILKIGETN